MAYTLLVEFETQEDLEAFKETARTNTSYVLLDNTGWAEHAERVRIKSVKEYYPQPQDPTVVGSIFGSARSTDTIVLGRD